MFAIGVFASFTALAACGGAEDSPPGPLARHFDDMFIADVDTTLQQGVFDSQREWSKAKAENANAESDYNEASVQLTAVKNEYQGTKLAISTAISNKKAAEQSADNNRINQAAKELHAAEAAEKAAAARVKYYEAYRGWLKKHWRYTQENMYWREAQYELTKSTLAQRNNKSPKGVDYNWFPKQEQERGKRTIAAKTKADNEKAKAAQVRDGWLKAQSVADKESGKASNLPDPMAQKTATTQTIAPSNTAVMPVQSTPVNTQPAPSTTVSPAPST
ncbi:MAG TPA: hypothetical protein VM513_12465, partial [Kofleriaceae bacterium]|nr:hypothetical protein [Kofleriaceae bacterium]